MDFCVITLLLISVRIFPNYMHNTHLLNIGYTKFTSI